MIVIPFYLDQVFWGQRVFELGVGSKPIKRAHLTVSRLCQALVDLQSNDHIRENARLLAERIHRENGAARAASIIDQAI